MPPPSFVSSVYCASPGASAARSFESRPLQVIVRVPRRRTAKRPMWETSKTPTPLRTARCSSITPRYWTGIDQPANGTMRAPRDTWRACSGVSRRVAVTGAEDTSLGAGSSLIVDRVGVRVAGRSVSRTRSRRTRATRRRPAIEAAQMPYRKCATRTSASVDENASAVSPAIVSIGPDRDEVRASGRGGTGCGAGSTVPAAAPRRAPRTAAR